MSINLAIKILPSPQNPASILLVEDEFLIRWVAAESLRDAGFTVIEARDGDEAAALLETDVHLDLVFSDVKMPGEIDGLDLARLVQTLRPGVPTLLTSGHCGAAEARDAGAVALLRKPYLMTDLVSMIELKMAGAT